MVRTVRLTLPLSHGLEIALKQSVFSLTQSIRFFSKTAARLATGLFFVLGPFELFLRNSLAQLTDSCKLSDNLSEFTSILRSQKEIKRPRVGACFRFSYIAGVIFFIGTCFIPGLVSQAIAQQGPEHAYFNSLITRPEHFKSYSLRDQTQLDTYKAWWNYPSFINYVYGQDPYPGAPDAAKISMPTWRPLSSAWVTGQLLAPLGPTDTTMTISYVYGNYDSSAKKIKIDDEIIVINAGTPNAEKTIITVPITQRGVLGTMPAAHAAGAYAIPSMPKLLNQLFLPVNTQDGHNYLFTWDVWFGDEVDFDVSSHSGWKIFAFDYGNGPIWIIRNPLEWKQYGPLGTTTAYSRSILDGPNVLPTPSGSDLQPRLANFGIHPRRWTRYWVLFEQKVNDWDTVSMWVADEVQEPVLIFDKLQQEGVVPSVIKEFRILFDTSDPGRFPYINNAPDLFAYMRNFAALQDVADPTAFLQKPISGQTISDSTPPSVSLSSPTGGTTVSGTVNITANASDNVAVAFVEFRSGAAVLTTDFSPPYSYSWNTTTAANGLHTLSAVARDTAGNTKTSSAVTVTVSNASSDTTAPTVSITAPSHGSTVSGSSVTVSANAADNIGVAGVQFKLDGTNLGGEDTSSPYSLSWNTTNVANGLHTLTAAVRDAAGNVKTSASVSVMVSNSAATPPSVNSVTTKGVTPHTFSLANVTSGNSIIVGLSQSDSGSRTYVVTDSQNNTYSSVVSAANSSKSQIFLARNVRGASSLNITVSVEFASNQSLELVAFEVAGVDGIDVTGTNMETGNNTTHNCSSSGINISSDSFILCVGTLYANGGNLSGAGGYSKVGNSNYSIFEYKTNSSALTNQQPSWTSSEARVGLSVVASFKMGGTVPSPDPTQPPSSTLKGDLNNDGKVNSLDWSIMSPKWLTSDAAADLNQDGIVNTVDFSIMNGNWEKTSQPPIADHIAPSVSIIFPSNNATLSETVSISATAMDNVGVAGVQFRVNGISLEAEDTNFPYTASWNTTLFSNGGHTLTAVARDAAGNIATSSQINVSVNNAAAALAITTTILPSARDASVYSRSLSAVGGTPPYTWSASGLGSGACSGLSILSSGMISGTPTVVGTCTFTARVTDSTSTEDTQDLSISIVEAGNIVGHPTIGMTQAELPSFRNHMKNYESSAFQAWLNRRDGYITPNCHTTNSCNGVDVGAEAMNFAFLGMLHGSTNWADSNFIVSDDFDTRAEACAIAYSFLNTPGAFRDPTPTIRGEYAQITSYAEASSRSHDEGTSHWMANGAYQSTVYLALPLVYDWCFDALTATQQDNLELDMSTYATNAFSTMPEWPYPIAGDVHVMNSNGMSNNRVATIIALQTLVNQGAVSPAVENYITEGLRKLWTNLAFTELEEVLTNDGSGDGIENRLIGYNLDVSGPLSIAMLLGRTIPEFAAQAPRAYTFYNTQSDNMLLAVYPDAYSSAPTPSTQAWFVPNGGTTFVPVALEDMINQFGMHIGVCRVYNLPCAGKLLSIFRDLWPTTNSPLETDTIRIDTTGIFSRFLGGWGGVTETDPTPLTARMAQGSFSWTDYASANAGQFIFTSREFFGASHAGGYFNLATFGTYLKGTGIFQFPKCGKGAYTDQCPQGELSSSSRIHVWRNTPTYQSLVNIKGRLTDLIWADNDPNWVARKTSFGDNNDFTFKRMSKMYASNPDHAAFGYAASDWSTSWHATVVGDSGFAEGKFQREVVKLGGVNFALVFDRATVVTPNTDKKFWTAWVSNEPTCVGGSKIKDASGYWRCSGSTSILIENKFGNPTSTLTPCAGQDNGTFPWIACDGTGGEGGPFLATDHRTYVIPANPGGYSELALRGYDPTFSTIQSLFPHGYHNLEAQQYGSSNKVKTVQVDHFGTAAAHTNGVTSCTVTLMDAAGITLNDDGFHEGILLPSFGGVPRSIISVTNTPKTITFSSAGGCPTISSASPVDYALLLAQQLDGGYRDSADDHRTADTWGRIDLSRESSNNPTDYFVVGIQYGTTSLNTPTAVREIDDSDQRGAQMHGGGVEAVILFSEAAPDIGSNMVDAVPQPPLGSVSYDFQCYPGTNIRHVLANMRAGTTYNVQIANPADTNCIATITTTGGSRRVIAGQNTLTFQSNGMIVSD